MFICESVSALLFIFIYCLCFMSPRLCNARLAPSANFIYIIASFTELGTPLQHIICFLAIVSHSNHNQSRCIFVYYNTFCHTVNWK